MCKIYFEDNVGYHLAIAMATKTKTGINCPTDRDLVLKTKLIKIIFNTPLPQTLNPIYESIGNSLTYLIGTKKT